MASTEYMDRQKLAVIIGITFFLVLAVLVIIISVIFNSGENEASPTPTSEPEPTKTSNILSDKDNDYSADKGYTPLPPDFDTNIFPLEETVVNDEFAYFTMNRLFCELSKKTVVTEEALEPIRLYNLDLTYNTSPYANSSREQIAYELEWFNKHMGEELTPEIKQHLDTLYCTIQEGEDLGHDGHDHE